MTLIAAELIYATVSTLVGHSPLFPLAAHCLLSDKIQKFKNYRDEKKYKTISHIMYFFVVAMNCTGATLQSPLCLDYLDARILLLDKICLLSTEANNAW